MNRPDDAQLRALARINSEEMNRRIARERARAQEVLDEMQATIDDLRKRTAACEQRLGIVPAMSEPWDDFNFDQSAPPQIERHVTDWGHGRR